MEKINKHKNDGWNVQGRSCFFFFSVSLKANKNKPDFKAIYLLFWDTIFLISKNLFDGWLIGKDSDAGRGWGQEEKGTTEDEMAGWHHRLDGLSLSELRELVMDREAWRAAIHGVAKSRTWLSNWTELKYRAAKIVHQKDFKSENPH